MAINGTTVGVPGVDVPLDTHALRFDFFLSWARKRHARLLGGVRR
jgi:hypothetical protein